MPQRQLPYVPHEVILKIIQLVGQGSFSYLGGFMWVGKVGYGLVHSQSILQTCNVSPMLDFTSCQIGKYDKEANNVFQQFGPNNNVLMSDDVFEMAYELQFRLSLLHAPTLNKYASTFKFPDDEVNPTPTCEFVHDINFAFEGGLLQNHDHETLVKMNRDGLREDIRSAISSTEFSTIDDIMHAALEVEEGESKMKHGDSSVREYNTSFLAGVFFKITTMKPLQVEEGEDSSESKGSPTESDDSSKCPKKKTRTKYKHNEDPEDEHSYDAGGSCTPNTLEEGSEEASDSEVDLKDYQEYFQNNHKSRSESSGESD
ncbi:hypothetical protein F2Q69_00036286 [Brassica cretica]|uniref:Uncharacterized protein n=1 Tax=Brassica cretica TaxID=69181 RepID=A0A8S9SM88_BRACR|nr:hypothetical protein F2Q69_00036286 [Brassica cretica]